MSETVAAPAVTPALCRGPEKPGENGAVALDPGTRPG